MNRNMKRMKAQWNPPPSPIEGLFKQLEEGRHFSSKANDDISKSLLVMLGYDNILATGQFTKYCAKWRGLEIVDTTWKDFRTTFTEYNEGRSDITTAEEAHYTMNQVQELIQQGVQ